MPKEVCIQMTAFDDRGLALCTRRYELSQNIDDAADYALINFIREISQLGILDKTVRLVSDMSVQEDWWLTEEQEADREAKLTAAGPGEERTVGPGPDYAANPVPGEQDEFVFDNGVGGIHSPRDTD